MESLGGSLSRKARDSGFGVKGRVGVGDDGRQDANLSQVGVFQPLRLAYADRLGWRGTRETRSELFDTHRLLNETTIWMFVVLLFAAAILAVRMSGAQGTAVRPPTVDGRALGSDH